jgi:hypothetical protein
VDLASFGIGRLAFGKALLGDVEDHQPERHMDLRRGETGAVGIFHGLEHIVDELVDVRSGRILDRVGRAAQDGVAHTGDLENSHGRNMG